MARVGEDSNTYRDLVRSPEKNRLLGSIISTIEDNIEV